MDHDAFVKSANTVVLAAAKAALPTPAKVLYTLLSEALGVFTTTGTERLAAALQAETEHAVLTLMPELRRRVERLEEAGSEPQIADVAHLLTLFAKSRQRAADPNKRKLLETAFLNSFNKTEYESGLLNSLWERLERLTYGDLLMLRRLVEASSDEELSQIRHEYQVGIPTSLGAFHGASLVREGLCAFHLGSSDLRNIKPTELGRRMHALARDADEQTATEPS